MGVFADSITQHGFVLSDGEGKLSTLQVPPSLERSVNNDRRDLAGWFTGRDGDHGFLATPK